MCNSNKKYLVGHYSFTYLPVPSDQILVEKIKKKILRAVGTTLMHYVL